MASQTMNLRLTRLVFAILLLTLSASAFRQAHFPRHHSSFTFNGDASQKISTNNIFPRVNQQSSMSLKYRTVDEETVAQGFYTDTLWHAALRPSFDQEPIAVLSDANTPLELRPIDVTMKKSKGSTDGLIETVKAFIPVVIEVGVVVAAAGSFQY